MANRSRQIARVIGAAQARNLPRQPDHGAKPLPKSVIDEANKKAREEKRRQTGEWFAEHDTPDGTGVVKGPGAKTIAAGPGRKVLEEKIRREEERLNNQRRNDRTGWGSQGGSTLA